MVSVHRHHDRDKTGSHKDSWHVEDIMGVLPRIVAWTGEGFHMALTKGLQPKYLPVRPIAYNQGEGENGYLLRSCLLHSHVESRWPLRTLRRCDGE